MLGRGKDGETEPEQVGRTRAAEGGIRKRRGGGGGLHFPQVHGAGPGAGVGDNTGRALPRKAKVNAGSAAQGEE